MAVPFNKHKPAIFNKYARLIFRKINTILVANNNNNNYYY